MGRVMTVIVGVMATMLASTVARGTNFTSNVNPSGNWGNPTSWSPQGVPRCGDTVTIVAGDTITVTNAQQVTSAVIQGGGHLDITGTSGTPAKLTVCGTGSPALEIAPTDGLSLTNRHATLAFAESTSIVGAGSLVGQNSDAHIELAPGGGEVVLTSELLIHGALTIRRTGDGSGTFRNYSEVRADVPGSTITLDESLAAIEDCQPGGMCTCLTRWVVAGGALRFGKGATGLKGSFWLDGGVVRICQSVATTGDVSAGAGAIISPGLLQSLSFNPGACWSGCPSYSPIYVLTVCP